MYKQFIILCLALLIFGTGMAQKNDIDAGIFTVEHPTLLNLGFEWSISGDENRNASVEVQFRAVGESTWRDAMPLVRIGGERIFRAREHLDYTVPHGFAGSILNLQSGTEYECKFEMSDPDGVQGKSSQTVKVTTRTEPQSYTGGQTLHVYPADFEVRGRNQVIPASYRHITGLDLEIGPLFGRKRFSRVMSCSCMPGFIESKDWTMWIQ